MGRGRAKAKQTKVARELKYNSGDMDLNRLRADLIHEGPAGSADEIDPELLAKYAVDDDTEDLYSADDDEDDEGTGYAASR
jgi:hypothetical protein